MTSERIKLSSDIDWFVENQEKHGLQMVIANQRVMVYSYGVLKGNYINIETAYAGIRSELE